MGENRVEGNNVGRQGRRVRGTSHTKQVKVKGSGKIDGVIPEREQEQPKLMTHYNATLSTDPMVGAAISTSKVATYGWLAT